MAEVMLVSPVSTREVTLADLSLLPDEETRVRWNHADRRERLGARAKGEILMADLDRYLPDLRLDILGKAVRHVHGRHGGIDRLILVASDQAEGTAEQYRGNDTVSLALVVREMLRRDKTLQKVGEQTKIMLVRENPADYEVMRAFYRQSLPEWCRELASSGVCYLGVTGGTAQMTTMLLFEGVRYLRARAVPLYVLEDYDMPQHLDIGQQILVDELVETLRRDLSVYAYHAAWKTANENQTILEPALAHFGALAPVLDCARRRLNFDFAAAQTALFGADRGLPAALRARVLRLADELSSCGRTTEWLITEVYHSATVHFRIEAYASFAGQVFRLQEALLRYLCERWGVRFAGKNGGVLDATWLDGHPHVADTLARAGSDAAREATRYSLEAVALALAEEAGDAQCEEWVKRLCRFDQIAGLRNQLDIAHGFEGVSLWRLADLYRPGGGPQIVADMASLVSEILGEAALENPYERINALCLELLERRQA